MIANDTLSKLPTSMAGFPSMVGWDGQLNSSQKSLIADANSCHGGSLGIFGSSEEITEQPILVHQVVYDRQEFVPCHGFFGSALG
jgi:hypothetical protein